MVLMMAQPQGSWPSPRTSQRAGVTSWTHQMSCSGMSGAFRVSGLASSCSYGQ